MEEEPILRYDNIAHADCRGFLRHFGGIFTHNIGCISFQAHT